MGDQEFSLGRLLVGLSLLVFFLGLIALGLEKTGYGLGKLPGDIHIKGEHGSFYLPITTSILLSVVVSLLLHLFKR